MLQNRAQKLEESGKRVVNEESLDYPEVLRLDLYLLFLRLRLNKEDAVKIRDAVNKLKEHLQIGGQSGFDLSQLTSQISGIVEAASGVISGFAKFISPPMP